MNTPTREQYDAMQYDAMMEAGAEIWPDAEPPEPDDTTQASCHPHQQSGEAQPYPPEDCPVCGAGTDTGDGRPCMGCLS